ncbi:3-deoxy-D-manno-octulosonic acid kinase [Shewanella sp. KT0246]|uniref:3-deoxy-D-manno-octulosonic acid kinase n=1 Tax=Shewanella sp. KT0246 TaxID=2815912 RepID=UPI001BC00D14|nr:3-deoxy-D-manno-octulosonic acid kinase [Shewanella sp. KT0246]GIU49702.1 3-deoxy-D-manno-octulosonic acid kinase [Shewanella sp. KT0246]
MQIKSTNKGIIAWCDDLAKDLTSAHFSPEYWQINDAIVGQSKGRYTTWFVQYQTQQWVLRHYWRGGLIEMFSKDAYIFTGFERTRAIAELAILETLHQEGFPVPRPISANVERFGIWYRADLLIELVNGADDLVALLTKLELTAEQWQTLGKTIAQFHARGVYHADLNAKNILFANQQFYLIDFDRGELKKPHSSWQQANLSRLLRSFNKEQTKLPNLKFNDQNWQQLLAGYNQHMS